MSVFRQFFLGLSGLVLAEGLAMCQQDDSGAALRATCEQFVVSEPGPGLSLAIQYGSADPVFYQCGSANLETERPISADTPFHLGSLTKQFVAFAVLQVARDGQIEMDAPIDRYLGGFARRDVPTVSDLLHHASGFYEHWNQWSLSDAEAESLEDIVDLARAQEYSNFEPGTGYAYTNLNYVLLAAILERVERRALPQILRERVFTPLGMNQSGFLNETGTMIAGRADGYSGAEAEQVDYVVSSILGDGGLYASARDLLLWQQEWRRPRLDDIRSERLAVQTSSAGMANRYAAGVQIAEVPGGRLLHHGGANRGASTWMGYFEPADLRVVVLANSDTFNAQAIGLQIIEALEQIEPDLRSAAPTSHQIDRDLGLYAGSLQGQPILLRVLANGGGAHVGALGGVMRDYRLNESELYERVDEPRLEVRISSSWSLEFFFMGQPFDTLFRLPGDRVVDADIAGCWASGSLPGAQFRVEHVEAGYTLSFAGNNPELLEAPAPGVWLAREQGVFFTVTEEGFLWATRAGIREILFEPCVAAPPR